jgi:hypothetical protein
LAQLSMLPCKTVLLRSVTLLSHLTNDKGRFHLKSDRMYTANHWQTEKMVPTASTVKEHP